jgi:hypothetical protein
MVPKTVEPFRWALHAVIEFDCPGIERCKVMDQCWAVQNGQKVFPIFNPIFGNMLPMEVAVAA